MKIFEKCVRVRLYNLCKDKISYKQHGFLPERSCTTQLIQFSETLAFNLNAKWQTDVIYFDFSKAFDSVNHDVLLQKLKYQFGIDGFLLNFLKGYLKGRKQRVTIDGCFSDFAQVESGVPQGSILGPLLFVLFINDLADVLNEGSDILMYADDTKIWRVIHSESDQIKLQEDINNMYAWSVLNKMNFHPDKCKVITIALIHNPFRHFFNNIIYYMNNEVLDNTSQEKDLGVIVTKQ